MNDFYMLSSETFIRLSLATRKYFSACCYGGKP